MKRVTAAKSGEIDALRGRLEGLMDRLAVDPEIRAGIYSDASVVADLFDSLATREEIEQRLAAVGLGDVAPSTALVTVLRRRVLS